jgi:O-antigen/teichoic acid export membrane protein
VSVRSHLRRLASESAVYGLPPIVNRLIGLFLTPIYTRIFAPAEYGAMSLVNSTIMAVAPLAALALDSAAFRWFYDSADTEDRKRTVASWFWTQVILGSVLALGISLVPEHALRSLTDRPDARLLFVTAAAAMPLLTFDAVLTNYFRMHRRPWSAVGFMLFSIAANIGLTLTFVVWLRVGLVGIFLALIGSRGMIAVAAVLTLRGWLSPRQYQLQRVRRMLRYSLPMVPTTLLVWVLNASDRYVIAHFWDAGEVGLYSIGVSIAAILVMLTGAFQTAWSPFAFSIADRPEAPSVYATVFEGYLLGTGTLALGLALFAPEALRILTAPQFYSAENTVALLATGYVMAGLHQITGLGAMLRKRTTPLLHAFMLAAAVKLVCSLALVPPFARVGAATASLIAQAALSLYLLRRAQAIYPIPYRTWLAVTTPIATLLVAYAGRALTHGLPILPTLLVKFGLVALFATQALVLPPVRARLRTRLFPSLARGV